MPTVARQLCGRKSFNTLKMKNNEKNKGRAIV